MTSAKRGICIIINNRTFIAGFNERAGTEQDAARLDTTFRQLGFDIDVHQDLTAENALQVLTEGLSYGS